MWTLKTTRQLPGSATGLSKTTLLIGGSAPIRTPSHLVAPGRSGYWTIGANPADSFASAG